MSNRPSGAPDTFKETRLKVDGDIARCPECTRYLGTVSGRHLHTGEVILLNRAVLRCRSCNTRLVWVPVDSPLAVPA